jgi:hypothetical protein
MRLSLKNWLISRSNTEHYHEHDNIEICLHVHFGGVIILVTDFTHFNLEINGNYPVIKFLACRCSSEMDLDQPTDSFGGKISLMKSNEILIP